ncbi:hypothetical protein AK830_g7818 [Neonectria ditissima]|uniref:O-methylsterigmatocystin oxidoreductase n=1 Tax=Neonectria ditissima TaxID=78410 RepID=A0A0P7B9A7_9HYPO|nr:hypothetical protein AK830_g7818 [Neonectria ditissima]
MEPTLFKAMVELGIIVFIVMLFITHWRTKHTLPLPPGPPGEFLLGHTRMIPKDNTAAVYARWSKEYKPLTGTGTKDSDVIHVKSLGQSIVVLNSVDAAREILERKGANFCDRPRFTLLEVMGWGKTLTFLPFGNRWQMHRKLLQTSFSNTNVRRWHKLQVTEARRTVDNILRRPDGWETSLRRLAVAIVLQVSYGTEVPHDDDPYIQIANDAMYATGNGGAPANSIVDMVPLARHLPDWLIRDWPLRFARQWRWAIQKLHDVPFAVAQAEHVSSYRKYPLHLLRRPRPDSGFASRECDQAATRLLTPADKENMDDNTSLAHQLLNLYRTNEALGNEQEWSLDDIKGAAGAVFIAGADTAFQTWATCVIFILNMVLHPEIQKKARDQLDLVVGPDRLPEFSDRGSLPYIEHIVQEVYRTVVYANAHAMAHDERIYQAPHDFNPDRYQPLANGAPGEPFPVGNFGFGRRVCVGRFLADNSVWIMVATMLSTLEFHKKLDQAGRPVEPRVSFTNGGTWYVALLILFPRSPQTPSLLATGPSADMGQKQPSPAL